MQGVKVVPSATEVSVSLARGLTKKIVTIHPVLQENLPKDYELGDVRTDPIKIEVAGDSKTIENLSSIDTEPIDLSKLTATKKMTVKLALPDGITVTNREVNVSIEVKKKSSN